MVKREVGTSGVGTNLKVGGGDTGLAQSAEKDFLVVPAQRFWF